MRLAWRPSSLAVLLALALQVVVTPTLAPAATGGNSASGATASQGQTLRAATRWPAGSRRSQGWPAPRLDGRSVSQGIRPHAAPTLGSRPHTAPLSIRPHAALNIRPHAAPLGGGSAFINEPFTGTSLINSGWVLGGNGPGGSGAYLTAGTTDGTTGTTDPSNAGWLRLTSESAMNSLGYAYYNVPLTLGNGLIISFDYTCWGGGAYGPFKGNGSDGTSLYLFDGSAAFSPGDTGGSLGYVGMGNAYAGIGLDEFGNFSGGFFQQEHVTIRGSGNGTGYSILTTTAAGAISPSLCSLDATQRPSTFGNGYQHYVVAITPDLHVTVAVYTPGTASVLINRFALQGAPGQEALPATLKFGFAGSTGAATDYLGCLSRLGAQRGCQGVAVTGAVSGGLCAALNTIHGLHRDSVLLHNNPDAFGPVLGGAYRLGRAVQDSPSVNALVDPVACAIGPEIPGALNAVVFFSGFVNPEAALDELAFGGLAQDASEEAATVADRATVAADPAVPPPDAEGAARVPTNAIAGTNATVPPPVAMILEEIALDNNTLIDALERGKLANVDTALAGRAPVVSIRAAREFLVKGDINALRSFLIQREGSVRGAATAQEIVALQAEATALGRAIKLKDASIAAAAIREGLPLLTRDERVIKFLTAAGYRVETYPFP